MDYQLPTWLRNVLRHLNFLAVPNLGGVLAGVAGVSFVAREILHLPMERIAFSPERILDGEWWRILTFIFQGGPARGGLMTLIFLIFFIMYIYYIMSTLEQYWGATALTVYVLLGYGTMFVISFLAMEPIDIQYFIVEYATLAFGSLFPNQQFNLYGIIPIKAKWFAVLAAGMIVFSFIGRSLPMLLCLPLAFLPYLLFFGQSLIDRARMAKKVSDNRKRFNKDMWR